MTYGTRKFYIALTTFKLYIKKPEGRRNIGRPKTRWEDDFREEGTGQGA